MTQDLFSSHDTLQPVPMPGADVAYLRQLALGQAPLQVMQQLIDEVAWKSERITVWGKSHLQPRLIAWYGDAGSRYAYSGMALEPLPWSDLLLDVKARVEAAAHTSFNSVLINYYRDQHDRMGFHSDDEAPLGKRPVIASLSLGASRTFVFKPREGVHAKDHKMVLESGSLLVMQGDTQRHWKHGIPKESRPCGPRVNLTFRRIGLND